MKEFKQPFVLTKAKALSFSQFTIAKAIVCLEEFDEAQGDLDLPLQDELEELLKKLKVK